MKEERNWGIRIAAHVPHMGGCWLMRQTRNGDQIRRYTADEAKARAARMNAAATEGVRLNGFEAAMLPDT